MMTQGSFEANIRLQAPGRDTYIEGGEERPLPPWPPEVDGIRFGVLERRGRWVITRVQFADQDLILHHPVPVDAMRHLGGRRRPGAAFCLLNDEMAEQVLDDVLAANGGQTNAVALLVNRVNQVRRAAREAAARSAEQSPERPEP